MCNVSYLIDICICLVSVCVYSIYDHGGLIIDFLRVYIFPGQPASHRSIYTRRLIPTSSIGT